MKKAPNDVDRHVGARVRMRRMLIGMSQEKLGDALGVTFQQVQKYEKGTNRISASRLRHISEILGVSIDYLYEGASGGPVSTPGFAESSAGKGYEHEQPMTPEAMKLVRALNRIKEPKVRRKLIELANALADAGEESGRSE